jgi:Rod binding domain-containing protein
MELSALASLASLGRDPSDAMSAANAAAASGDKRAMQQSSVEFESVFLSAMLAPMFETLSTEEPFGGGEAEQTWRGLLSEQYAGSIARSGGVGIADSVLQQLVALQERGSK